MSQKKAIGVLIVAEDPEDTQLLRKHVRDFSEFTVESEHAMNLAQALYLLRNAHFDLILLVDSHDSGITAKETLEGFRECRIALPVVIVISAENDQTVAEMTKMGACGCLNKEGLTAKLLEQTVKGMLEQDMSSGERDGLNECKEDGNPQ